LDFCGFAHPVKCDSCLYIEKYGAKTAAISDKLDELDSEINIIQLRFKSRLGEPL
jgi:hypothetical protein